VPSKVADGFDDEKEENAGRDAQHCEDPLQLHWSSYVEINAED